MLSSMDADPQHPLGVMQPRNSRATLEKLAINAVMAGCKPEHFPVVVAGVRAAMREGFNLAGTAATTGGAMQVMIVNGPVARSRESADAVIETLLVEPEGVARESVANARLSADGRMNFPVVAPPEAIPGSGRAYVALTGGYLAQTLDGLENLLQMPFGCGEQNMILFPPNIYVSRYLEANGQAKPEVSAKAEFLMATGYQRQLTYRRNDGSFSAFGQNDPTGSLWLTDFVLKSFAQANGLIFVDDAVVQEAKDWIRRLQRSDGSFEPIGFLHHQELLGGLRGNMALTGYVAIALLEAGDRDASASALSFLESQLNDIADAYTMAIAAHAMAVGDSPRASDAHKRLMDMGITEGDELYWDGAAAVETTGYATLALLERGDGINAGRAARWLVKQRNAFGGYGSTQDTVVGLQALTGFAANARFDMDMTVELTADGWSRQVFVNPANADVVQIVELPTRSRCGSRPPAQDRPWSRWCIATTCPRWSARQWRCSVSRSTMARTTWQLTT